MSKSVTKNYLYNLIYQLIIILLPIILIPILAQRLLPSGTGRYAFAYSIVSYFSIFALLGTLIYGNKTISLSRNDPRVLKRVFWEIFSLKVITSMIALISYYLITFFLEDKYILWIQGIFIFSNMLDISWFFTGTENFKPVVLRNTLVKITAFICILIFVKSESDLWLYALIMTGSEFIGHVLMWFETRKHKLLENLDEIKSDFDISRHLKGTLNLFLPQVITLLYTTMNATMIGAMTNVEEVGYFDMSAKIINTLLTILTSLGLVMLPHISNLLSQNKIEEVKKSLNQAFRLVGYLSFPMAIGVMMISSMFIPWFLGPNYTPSIIILCVLSGKLIFVGFSNIMGIQYLIPSNQNKLFTYSVLIGSLSNIALNVFLIPTYGAIGASISIIISEGMVMIFHLVVTKNQMPFIKFIYESWKSITASFIMCIALYLFSMYVNNKLEEYLANSLDSRLVTPAIIIINIIIGILVYILTLFVFRDKTQKMLIGKVFRLLLNR